MEFFERRLRVELLDPSYFCNYHRSVINVLKSDAIIQTSNRIQLENDLIDALDHCEECKLAKTPKQKVAPSSRGLVKRALKRVKVYKK